ncbi:MAG: hypothetical protein ACRBN8_11120 [Nannocystales bacterium]
MPPRPLDMQAERFCATGNIASEGMRNQLGRPRLDRLAVLIREAAQNAWDAKRDDSESVTFGISSFELSKSQVDFLASTVFAELPPIPEDGPEARLSTLIDDASNNIDEEKPSGLSSLVIYDRGTTGLGGPTRANRLEHAEEARDFVDFLRNIGQPPDKSRGGGTFGYGKAALYLSSGVSTILVHTRCRSGRKVESRFIVSSLTDHYRTGEAGYTGRHWWGKLGEDDIVDPVTGSRADRIAAELGMPEFEDDERGTTIMLLAPRYGERSTEQAMAYMTAQMLWNFWPKMVAWPGAKTPQMHFEAWLEEEPFPVPRPEESPPFDEFAQVLQSVRKAEGSEAPTGVHDVIPVACLRPKRHLGLCRLTRIPRRERPDADYGDDEELPAFLERCHHVALLRRAELVVTYHPGPPLPNDHVEYVGVFFADDEMDRTYAASEPPTHDEWRPENLAVARERTFIRTTFKRLDKAMNELVAPADTSHDTIEDQPLAALASHLGRLLVGAEGPAQHGIWEPLPATGGGLAGDSLGGGGGEAEPGEKGTLTGDSPTTRKKRKRGATLGRPKVELSTAVELVVEDDRVYRVFGAQIQHGRNTAGTRLTARAFPIISGGAEESDPPVGAEPPEIANWRDPAGRPRGRTSSVDVAADEEGVWTVWVGGAADALVGLDLTAEGLEGEGR